jgi:hypothetical protein
MLKLNRRVAAIKSSATLAADARATELRAAAEGERHSGEGNSEMGKAGGQHRAAASAQHQPKRPDELGSSEIAPYAGLCAILGTPENRRSRR